MKIARRVAMIFALLCMGNYAFACKPLTMEPRQKFEAHSVVVLAYPIATSTTPNNALTREFQGEFKQTIQWQVLVSWKGSYKPGDVFTTMKEHETSMCGTYAQYEREVMLLFLDGKEPYDGWFIDRPINELGDLKYLDRLHPGS